MKKLFKALLPLALAATMFAGCAGGSQGGSGDSGSGGGGSGGDYVWISATGSKYHKRNDCGTMNPNNASRVTTEEARNRGLEPCRKCFP